MAENDAPLNETQQTERDDSAPPNFIADIIDDDLSTGKNEGRLMTRFPPEPNGYLHIGHAKSICLNFGMAQKAPQGVCNLRFDDTNPTKEDVEFVDSIQADVKWLGFDWGNRLYFASDYFEQLYAFAVKLIKAGKAYVDSQTQEQIREHRGNFYKAGVDSPFRNRSVEENLDLFARMRAGEFPEGAHVLRAKIDMQSKNLNMRDPLMYRIRYAHHHRTGDKWCIYPIYDYAHGLSDAIEGVTHSICTLEFEDHRPLYDWFIDEVGTQYKPRQIEFARLNITYMVMSKRRLLQLVEENHVRGWDDPRMPTIAGMRRRGVTPAAIRNFAERVGVAKQPQNIEISLFEHAIRDDLNATSKRVMAVLDPLRVVIENFPEGASDEFEGAYNSEDPSWGSRKIPFSRVIYIEREDFAENPPKKWFRLAPGKEIRLRYACIIKCESVVKDAAGNITELRCTWDPDSRGGSPKDGRKIKGTSHWVSAAHAVDAEVRVYDRLFTQENPMDVPEGKDFKDFINKDSLKVLTGCKLEPSLASSQPGDRVQFERLGYFCADLDSKPGALVFNRTISLKDTWSKVAAKE